MRDKIGVPSIIILSRDKAAELCLIKAESEKARFWTLLNPEC